MPDIIEPKSQKKGFKHPVIKGWGLQDCITQKMSKGATYTQAYSVCKHLTGKMPKEV